MQLQFGVLLMGSRFSALPEESSQLIAWQLEYDWNCCCTFFVEGWQFLLGVKLVGISALEKTCLIIAT